MTQPVRQESFRGGEIAPEFYGRSHDPRHAQALRLCRNFLPLVHGSMVNRAGTKLVAHTKNDAPARLVGFVFSDTQSFVLVFTDQAVRLINNGGVVNTVRPGNPGVPAGFDPLITYALGDRVLWINIVGNAVYESTANGNLNHTPYNGFVFSPFWKIVLVPFELVTPYLTADLQRLKSAQGGDVVTVAHPGYQPRELTRLANDNWTLDLVTFSPPAGFIPTALAILANGFGGDNAAIWLAGTHYSSGDYVNDGTATWIAIAPSLNKAPPAPGGVYNAIQSAANSAYWQIAIDALHAARSRFWVVTARYKDKFGIEREGLPTAPLPAFTVLDTDRPVRFGWAAPAAPVPAFDYKLVGYSVYRGENGLFGWIGDTDAATLTFKDVGDAPNFGIQPPKGTNPFLIADGANAAATFKWPGAVAFHDQRRIFARSDVLPDHFFGSAVANVNRFDRNLPPQDAEAFDWRISSQKLQEIRSLLSKFGRLCLFAGQGEFVASGPANGQITPNAVNAPEVGDNGSSYLDPLGVEHALLFNTAKGNTVRDFAFDFNVNGFAGVDLSDIARHLFKGRTIVSWAHARAPYHLAWIVRDDGVLLSLTYDRSSQTIAWAQHATDGLVEQVCCVPEGTEDALYLVVNRNGSRLIERMASRELIPDTREACFLDSAVEFDGRNTGATTISVGGAPVNPLDAATLTASVASFALTDVGDRVVLDPDGKLHGPYVFTVTGFVSTTQLQAVLESSYATGPADFPGPTTSWAFGRDTLTGLDHLNGKDVMVLSDGGVQGPFTVGGGQIGPLNPPAVIAVAGLPYNSDAELLDLASDAAKPNVKAVLQVIFELVASGGVSAGQDFDHLRPAKIRKVSDGVGAPVPVTGQVPVTTDASWNTGGRAVVRMSDPLPLTITGITREVEVGGRG